MNHSLLPLIGEAPRERLERHPRQMAKADLTKVESREFREEIGGAVRRARELAGLSQKELAGAMRMDNPAQLARWEAGTETAQFHRLFAVEAMQKPLVTALARLAQIGVTVRVVIELEQAG